MVRRHQGRGALHDEIKEAFDKLVSDHPEIETVSAVGSFSDVEVCKNEKDNEKWSFSIRLKDVRDKKGALVTLEFRGDSMFPWSEVEVFTENYCGLPHQRLRDGKLCLDPERILNADSAKIEGVYQQALEWLNDAYSCRLAKQGEPYEFPDFYHGRQTRIEVSCRLLYAEDGKGFEFVQNVEKEKRYGVAELVYSKKNMHEAYLRSLRVQDCECQFEDSNWPVSAADGIIRTVPFVVFDDIDIVSHRPPITWGELLGKIRNERDDVEKLLKCEWEANRYQNGYLLVGWFAPKVYGEEVSHLAWRFASFATREWEREHVKMRTANCRERRRRASNWINSEILDEGAYVAWCPSDNISQSERLIRWRLSAPLRNSKICLVGCGALGSQVAELLVRGGCRRLVLVDSDFVEYGNLCRHVLTSLSVGEKKASMLALRLKSIIPDGCIEVYTCGLPGDGTEISRCAQNAVSSSDVVIDCTGDVNCGMWLSLLTGNNKLARGVRAFMSGEAEFLSLCLSGKNRSLHKVEIALNETMQRSPEWEGMDWERYKAKDELMVRGAGCWSATFPGSWINITMFAGVVVNRINAWLQTPYDWDGEFSIYRCDLQDSGSTSLRLVGRELC